ncbi:MAG: Abi family protein [Roseburia sp.]|nr:Abi family protein [Roseburia sp.]
MNRTNKPKLTSNQLVSKLKNDKGVTFKYVDEQSAEKFLYDRNNYMRTASYRKNYVKYTKGQNMGKYINLDFGYLKELSILDMYLRDIIVRMCIDIEHDLKVKLVNDVESDTAEDGYDIVDRFLNQYSYIKDNKLAAMTSSPYTCGLVSKYFIINKSKNKKTGKIENVIQTADCPVWVIVELLAFGDFMRLYDFYYRAKGNVPVSYKVLNLVRNLRNGCAHNNCILTDLTPRSSVPPVEVATAVSKISSIKSNQRKKKMSSRVVMEFVSMLYVYDLVVSEKVKFHRIQEFKMFWNGRMIEKKEFFKSNDLLVGTYDFIKKVTEAWF